MPEARDKRVARRVPSSRAIEWEVPRRRMFRSVPVVVDATLVNVSVTGLGVVAATEPLVNRGLTVRIICDGQRSMAVVRRIDPMPAGSSFYGLELLDARREFIEAVLSDTEMAERRRIEDVWNRQ